jgi:large subunit ribosomal protein L32e
MERLIKIKEVIKKKTPVFTRADAHKKKRVGTTWRKPKGIQNKMRLNKKGYRVNVRAGYKTPCAINDTYKGLIIARVETLKELRLINPKTHAALIGKVGRMKKEQLIQEAQQHNITLVNLSVTKYQEQTKRLQQERVTKKKALAEKAATKKKKEKEAENKKTLEQAAKEDDTPSSEEHAQNVERSGHTELSVQNTDTSQRSEPRKTKTAERSELGVEEKDAEKKEKDKILTSKKGY